MVRFAAVSVPLLVKVVIPEMVVRPAAVMVPVLDNVVMPERVV